jgi:hypothetical protein
MAAWPSEIPPSFEGTHGVQKPEIRGGATVPPFDAEVPLLGSFRNVL